MIARIWRGKTNVEHYEEYSQFMRERAIPDYQNTEGLLSLNFLRRIEDNVAHFELITYWKDISAIKGFAGDEFELAKYYPEDEGFLLEFEKRVQHYEVFAQE